MLSMLEGTIQIRYLGWDRGIIPKKFKVILNYVAN